MALLLDVEPGDTVRIGVGTRVRVERKSGQRARLHIESEYSVALDRAGSEQSADRPRSDTPPNTLIRRPIPAT